MAFLMCGICEEEQSSARTPGTRQKPADLKNPPQVFYWFTVQSNILLEELDSDKTESLTFCLEEKQL